MLIVLTILISIIACYIAVVSYKTQKENKDLLYWQIALDNVEKIENIVLKDTYQLLYLLYRNWGKVDRTEMVVIMNKIQLLNLFFTKDEKINYFLDIIHTIMKKHIDKERRVGWVYGLSDVHKKQVHHTIMRLIEEVGRYKDFNYFHNVIRKK